MKRSCLVILLLFTAIICFSCSLPVVEQYDNFLADLDVEMRLDMCMKQIHDENPSAYTRADLKTIQEDLATLNISDQRVTEINRVFTDTAKELQQSVKLFDAEDINGAKKSYQKAYDLRMQAKDLLHELHEGGPPSV
ncbi:MAG: hypothetical protein VB081_13230 [Christensenella sp.]|uniref:hypothetical protein n=1 Tax=Christensenella sp. TaxID=1935934 RepID=UPI002B1ED910|nr:hypothetical protein [Christensenella sp.]MEA5004441.1 hypothetical protein [Christensenella sp.]